MPTKVEFMSEKIGSAFLSDYRELLAHFSSQAVVEAIRSFLTLNYSAEELTTAPITPGVFRKMLATALLTLINRDAITPLIDFNQLAENDLNDLRKEVGVDVELIPELAPVPPTAEELLAEEVRSDWKKLTSDQIRKKRNASRPYGLMLDRLANDGTLESSVTSLTRAGA